MAEVSDAAGARTEDAAHDAPQDEESGVIEAGEAEIIDGSPFVEGAEIYPAPRQRPPDAPLHWFLLILSVVVIGIALVLAVPGEGRTNEVTVFGATLPELCTSKRFLNRECPGCGMTRCFISLAHFDIARAWQFNPAGIFLFAVLLVQIPYRIVQLVRIRTGRMPLHYPWLVWSMWLLPVFLLAQWVIRSAI